MPIRGLEALAPYLQPGQTIAVLGSSGVGKSTLINRLLGEERLATREVRDSDHRGRHTTTHRELVPLPGGALLIDTPGMRELQLWTADAGVSEAFDDITQLAANCYFTDCQHDSEPRCAVKAAVENGTLPADRLESFHKLQREQSHLEKRQDTLAQQTEKKKLRTTMRAVRKSPPDEGSDVSHATPGAAPAARPTRVQLLVTCLVDSLFPDIGFSVVTVLERLGVHVDVPAGQTCCGQPAFNAGSFDEARAVARHSSDVLRCAASAGRRPVGLVWRHGHSSGGALLDGDPASGTARTSLASAARSSPRSSSRARRGRDARRGGTTVAYHPSCHLLRGLGVEREPHAVLDAIAGVRAWPFRPRMSAAASAASSRSTCAIFPAACSSARWPTSRPRAPNGW